MYFTTAEILKTILTMFACRCCLLSSDMLAAKEKHDLKAEAMRELGNIYYSVRNVRLFDDISLSSV